MDLGYNTLFMHTGLAHGTGMTDMLYLALILTNHLPVLWHSGINIRIYIVYWYSAKIYWDMTFSPFCHAVFQTNTFWWLCLSVAACGDNWTGQRRHRSRFRYRWRQNHRSYCQNHPPWRHRWSGFGFVLFGLVSLSNFLQTFSPLLQSCFFCCAHWI